MPEKKITEKKNRRPKLRPLKFELDCLSHAEGSCLASMGLTRVLCAATVEEKLPAFLEGGSRGWVTAEYAMLPRSTHTRQERERSRGKPDSRALEISRLIGRALRMSVDPEALGPRTVILDCDVIQADGGTRCCAVNGAVLALYCALSGLLQAGAVPRHPLKTLVAAVSAGLVGGKPVLDLDYENDRRAEVDLNVVMTAGGRLVELQGAAEKEPFTQTQLQELLHLAAQGINQIISLQKKALGLD